MLAILCVLLLVASNCGIASAAAGSENVVSDGDLKCQAYNLIGDGVASNIKEFCDDCYWLEGKEQDGSTTGRCYQCSQQTTQEGCQGTGVCLWMEGRDQVGGIDCTLCAGRTQDDCQATKYCFWDVEGFEGVCSKCPGHLDADSCAAAGCFWRKVQGVEKCVKCGGFHLQENCEAAGCKWKTDLNACRGNSDIFLLPPTDTGKTTGTSSSTLSANGNGNWMSRRLGMLVAALSLLSACVL